MTQPPLITVNGRTYAFPQEPVVVVCIDGSDPEYHRHAVAAGRMPFTESIANTGSVLTGDCVMPSFTNPNNASIATGAPPAVHGICGNTFFDADLGDEQMMNDPAFLKAGTIFAAFEQAGADVAVVTAKDKLRRLLGHELETSVCFSAEKADLATVEENGITDVLELVGRPMPSVYSADLSEFVMAAGVELLKRRRPDLMYLTLTDFVQHKFAPGTPEANDFYAMLDRYFAELDALGVVLVVTADHGMSAKSDADGAPRIVYLQEKLDEWVGAAASRVVLPIADPYTRHHGSLGSFALVYVDADAVATVAEQLAAVPGVAEVVSRAEASARFALPADRIGDLVVIADSDVTLGRSTEDHDLTLLDRPLRSHGGLSEQRVPVIVNRSLAPLPAGHRLRNFDAYWLGLNFVAPATDDLEARGLLRP